MVRMDKPYTFEGPDGTLGLLDLFEGRPQLVVHHFMFGPDWDQGCPSCSSAADGIGKLRQLHVRNTTLVAVSRAPYEKLAAFRARMGWSFPWYSSYGSDFNYDFHATLDDRVAPVLLHFRTQEELAAESNVDRTSIVSLLDQLEARGVAERRVHPKDRRKRCIFLTEEGERTLEKLRAVATEAGDELFAPLTARERDQLAALLRKLAGV